MFPADLIHIYRSYLHLHFPLFPAAGPTFILSVPRLISFTDRLASACNTCAPASSVGSVHGRADAPLLCSQALLYTQHPRGPKLLGFPVYIRFRVHQ